MQTINELFNFFDKNSDGVISRAELIELVDLLLDERGLGSSSEILREFDNNKNGVIDYEEFIVLYNTYCI